MDGENLKLVADLAAELSTLMEITYKPADMRSQNPEASDALSRAFEVLVAANAAVPEELAHIVAYITPEP